MNNTFIFHNIFTVCVICMFVLILVRDCFWFSFILKGWIHCSWEDRECLREKSFSSPSLYSWRKFKGMLCQISQWSKHHIDQVYNMLNNWQPNNWFVNDNFFFSSDLNKLWLCMVFIYVNYPSSSTAYGIYFLSWHKISLKTSCLCWLSVQSGGYCGPGPWGATQLGQIQPQCFTDDRGIVLQPGKCKNKTVKQSREIGSSRSRYIWLVVGLFLG